MRKNLKPEAIVANRVSNLMITKYPKIPFRFDTGADVKLPVHVARALHKLHGKWAKGYPDVLICTCRDGYGGLYVELKKDGELEDTEHTRRQARYHAVLRHNGYKVTFACGFKEAKKAIKKYLKGKK